ncbi:hypothetical protein [Pelosinus sp. IPA-1]|uniref:hypothetical protein n=1 Tax=Pelosinus sp. IPA-1 TaxID=3029569 RepID=UPI00243626DA|nr:hypothetical protein [Pelosinus sp. IPA-1]GMB01046.1 hypothetical protein PIPA1_38450 [Pelosinus sp. IPA-1]
MKEYINIKKILELADSKKWSIPVLADELNIDYSYLSRVINKEKPGGAKLILGVLNLCFKEGLDHKEYIFLNIPLSTDNGDVLQNETSSTVNPINLSA